MLSSGKNMYHMLFDAPVIYNIGKYDVSPIGTRYVKNILTALLYIPIGYCAKSRVPYINILITSSPSMVTNHSAAPIINTEPNTILLPTSISIIIGICATLICNLIHA